MGARRTGTRAREDKGNGKIEKNDISQQTFGGAHDIKGVEAKKKLWGELQKKRGQTRKNWIGGRKKDFKEDWGKTKEQKMILTATMRKNLWGSLIEKLYSLQGGKADAGKRGRGAGALRGKGVFQESGGRMKRKGEDVKKGGMEIRLRSRIFSQGRKKSAQAINDDRRGPAEIGSRERKHKKVWKT